jgi:hypothetical protein
MSRNDCAVSEEDAKGKTDRIRVEDVVELEKVR